MSTKVEEKFPETASTDKGTKSDEFFVGLSQELLDREKEYKRLNEELEKRTSQAYKSAESAVQESLRILNGTGSEIKKGSSALDNNEKQKSTDSLKKDSLQRPMTARSVPQSKVSTNRPKTSAGSIISTSRRAAGVKSHVLTKSDRAEKLSQELEQKALNTDFNLITDESIGLAEGMGIDATLRLLKAKVHISQEELLKAQQSNLSQETQLAVTQEKMKAIEEDKNKLFKNYQSLQIQMEKMKQQSDLVQQQKDGLQVQVVSLRKEVETFNKSHKSTEVEVGSKEIRLNRALEEIEKLKNQLHKVQSTSKEQLDAAKKTSEQLSIDNKRLDKQKQDILTAFKKQMQLIDVLKKQKIHMEATKMLSFTENEFSKLLDWEG